MSSQSRDRLVNQYDAYAQIAVDLGLNYRPLPRYYLESCGVAELTLTIKGLRYAIYSAFDGGVSPNGGFRQCQH